MTGPLPPSAAKHDATYKQNRPPSLSCAYACERFCIRSGWAKGEGNDIPRAEPDLAAVLALAGWSNHHNQTKHTSSRELLKKESLQALTGGLQNRKWQYRKQEGCNKSEWFQELLLLSLSCLRGTGTSYLWLGSILGDYWCFCEMKCASLNHIQYAWLIIKGKSGET